ncbi:MAG: hypothetical protein CMH83_11395 [Nocardioides sp.]|nr:hypothetical protein [Nocardioides sp.]
MSRPPAPPTVSLHLHPDWPARAPGLTVLESVVRDGRYLSQFATGTSNGGLTAHPGGDRWRWESRLFEGRYDDAPAPARPVYGALDRGWAAYGPAPRFGSAYLLLRPAVLERTTFCFPDSVLEPAGVVGPDGLAPLEQAAAAARTTGGDPLDDYVEAHVHGGVGLDDVAGVVLDPTAADTPGAEAARAAGLEVRSHPGYDVAVAGLPDDYRGPGPVALARRLARDGRLDPALLAAAAARRTHDPQALKRAWHLLARFGRRV